MKKRYTPQEKQLITTLNTPQKVQAYLDKLPYNWEKNGDTILSFREVVAQQKAHCLEAVFFAAAVLEKHGYPPLVLDLESIDYLDHCLFLYQEKGLFGAIGVSRERELYGKKASFSSVKDLVMSYYDDYIDYTACIKGYAVVNLDSIPYANWRFSKRNLWKIQNYLSVFPHKQINIPHAHFEHVKQKYLRDMKAQMVWSKILKEIAS